MVVSTHAAVEEIERPTAGVAATEPVIQLYRCHPGLPRGRRRDDRAARDRSRGRGRRVRRDHGPVGLRQVDAPPAPGRLGPPDRRPRHRRRDRPVTGGRGRSARVSAARTSGSSSRARTSCRSSTSRRTSSWLPASRGRPVDRATARGILARVGLDGRGRHRPAQLSGGEQQRAALAAVLVTAAPIVLADEITGELDSANAELLLDLLARDPRAREGMTARAGDPRPVGRGARRPDRRAPRRPGRQRPGRLR